MPKTKTPSSRDCNHKATQATTQPPANHVPQDDFEARLEARFGIKREQYRHNVEAWDKCMERWKQHSNLIKDMAELDDQAGVALVGLFDLYRFGETFGEDAHNWLGCFLFDMLRLVARDGAAAMNNSYEAIHADLEYAHQNVESDLRSAKKFVDDYQATLIQLADKREMKAEE
jgi:hypothetical protein